MEQQQNKHITVYDLFEHNRKWMEQCGTKRDSLFSDYDYKKIINDNNYDHKLMLLLADHMITNDSQRSEYVTNYKTHPKFFKIIYDRYGIELYNNITSWQRFYMSGFIHKNTLNILRKKKDDMIKYKINIISSNMIFLNNEIYENRIPYTIVTDKNNTSVIVTSLRISNVLSCAHERFGFMSDKCKTIFGSRFDKRILNDLVYVDFFHAPNDYTKEYDTNKLLTNLISLLCE
jgi:hypothetical protein